jgi:hypothetical protein
MIYHGQENIYIRPSMDNRHVIECIDSIIIKE